MSLGAEEEEDFRNHPFITHSLLARNPRIGKFEEKSDCAMAKFHVSQVHPDADYHVVSALYSCHDCVFRFTYFFQLAQTA